MWIPTTARSKGFFTVSNQKEAGGRRQEAGRQRSGAPTLPDQLSVGSWQRKESGVRSQESGREEVEPNPAGPVGSWQLAVGSWQLAVEESSPRSKVQSSSFWIPLPDSRFLIPPASFCSLDLERRTLEFCGAGKVDPLAGRLFQELPHDHFDAAAAQSPMRTVGDPQQGSVLQRLEGLFGQLER